MARKTLFRIFYRVDSLVEVLDIVLLDTLEELDNHLAEEFFD